MDNYATFDSGAYKYIVKSTTTYSDVEAAYNEIYDKTWFFKMLDKCGWDVYENISYLTTDDTYAWVKTLKEAFYKSDKFDTLKFFYNPFTLSKASDAGIDYSTKKNYAMEYLTEAIK